MEENSEANMDSGVSSTTEDVQEVPEVQEVLVTGAHRDVETVITVESIKEEDMSSQRNKTGPEVKSPDKVPPIKIKLPPQDLTIKKIIIKSPHKDPAIKPVPKPPSKSEEPPKAPKILVKDVTVNKVMQPSVSHQLENPVDSSSKAESQTSNKDVEKTQNNFITSTDIQKTAQKSPVKDSQFQESILVKEVVPKTPLSKEQQGPAKESVVKVLSAKQQSTKESPVKEQANKLNSTKEIPHKMIIAKESPLKITFVKDTSSKAAQIKEQVEKTPPAKEPPLKIPPTETEKPVENVNKIIEGEIKNKNLSILEDKEASNDSQIETTSDTSEREHNKSISRELRSLINSAKESKIISECTQLTSKTRKSRSALDTSNTSLNTSVEPEKIQGIRRGSDNSQKSNSSEKSDKTVLKRSMRSQNPEFVSKVKNFLNSVSGKNQKVDDVSDEETELKHKESVKELTPCKKKKLDEAVVEKPNKLRTDPYCWRCHWAVDPATNEKAHPPVTCSVCPRAFHFKCLTSPERSKINVDKNWVCPECLLILQAESSESRSMAMKKISLGMLCDLLKHALDRMMEVNGVEPFTHPVDRSLFPDYDKYVVHPMDLGQMRNHITEGLYGSTEAFLADAQWILHNSIIFNTLQAKLTGGARALVRSCRAEMSEIEACPECYAAAHARRPTWFTDVCSTPHILLWAKLKGFPYWPAKGMSVSSAGLVDVRFFGAHDRAWVPARDCFLYSEKDPNNFRTKRQDILDSMQEAEQHIRNISRKYGKFVYPPFKTQFDPSKLNEQIKMLIPSFEGEIRSPVKDKPSNSSPSMVKDKSRSNSKSSKGSLMDGDISDLEDNGVRSRKMADGAEIAREEDDYSLEKDKDKSMEAEVPQNKDNEMSRKRRRSELEEAVITIIDSIKEKRKRVESVEKGEEKKDSKEPTDNKETQEPKEQIKNTHAKVKESEPSTSTDKKCPRLTPVRVISITKVMKQCKSSPKPITMKDEEKTPNTKQKAKLDKSNSNDKDKSTPQDEKKSQKRRNSKNKSLNTSNVGKSDKAVDKKTDTPKEKVKDNTGNKNSNVDIDKPSTSTSNTKSNKNRMRYNDDTSLAVIAREVKNSVANPSGLPTISSVRSLSTAAQNTNNDGKTVEVTIEATSDSSIFTPTSTDNVRNMKEAVNKLQKLRGENDPPPVGRVGVRAFARMTSPPEKETRSNNDVQVEIKSEPMDFEESERQLQEKMDLMSAFKLRPVNPPVNPPAANLREVRINKVVVTPVNKKSTAPPQQAPIRAKKTFPQPKKTDEGRSDLTIKNSMVYIPIQPPVTQAPVRPTRPPVAGPIMAPQTTKAQTPLNNNTSGGGIINTVTPPLMPGSVTTFPSPSTSTTTSGSNSSTPIVGVPTVGQVPTTVHTMPLITSVNGQWTFSLQPVLSVGGGLDSAPSPPMVNGLADRPALLPMPPVHAPAALASGPTPVLPPSASTSNRTSTDTHHPGEPPRLQQRPSLVHPLDPNSPMGNVPPPSTVGPLTAKLNQNAVKMTDFFRSLLEESLERLEEPTAQLTAVKLQLEQIQWRHQQEINEIKHNHELAVAEMRSSFEKEKVRLVNETRRQTQVELDAAVKLAKSKQWCANCNQEAQFYCCWNTSYCDYPCQRAHWAQHYAVCTQQRNTDSSDNPNSPDRLPPPPDNLPKTTAAPNLTVGGKLAPSRVYTQEQHAPKSSIIVSMVEDNTGNQTMKCLGSYKSPNIPTQMSPLILNKQIMSSEEAAKKVVTSGGYLIVGATNSAPNTTITSARRAHTIQYIS